MKDISTMLNRSNLSARERFIMLIQNDLHKARTGERILTEADEIALENFQARDDHEASVWNVLNAGWKYSGRMDIEAELTYKEAQAAYLGQLPMVMNLLEYPIQRKMKNFIRILKDMKTVTIQQAAEMAEKQKVVKLKNGLDFDYALYQLAFEKLNPEDQERMKELYPDIEFDHQYLDQEEVIANLFNGKEELTEKAKKKLATLIAEASYNKFAHEHQLYHYFACIPILKVAQYFLKSKSIEVKDESEETEDETGLYLSDRVLKAMETYASEHNETIENMLKKGFLGWLNHGLFDEHTPLVISSDAELFERWLKSKALAKKTLLKHVNAGELEIRKRTDQETIKDKLYSKHLYDGELDEAKRIFESIGEEVLYKSDTDERKAFEIFDEMVITGESLYAFKQDYGFVKEFRERVDRYDPNLGIVYADDDPEHRGQHLDQEFVICGMSDKGVPNIFSRFGMASHALSGLVERQGFFKEVKEDGRLFLKFKSVEIEVAFLARRQDLLKEYAKLLGFEKLFKRLSEIFEADMTYHISERIKAIREFMEQSNQAVQAALDDGQDRLKKTRKGIFKRKEVLEFEDDLGIIDIDAIKPDEKAVAEHEVKLRGIFRNF